MAKDKLEKKKFKETASKQEHAVSQEKEGGIWQDERFQHLVTDPRFKNLPKAQRKVKIDKRFQGMFTDDKFKVKYTVDKYGRKVNKSNADDLKKYYEISESQEEGEDDDEEEERRKEEKAISRDTDDSGESSASEVAVGANDELVSDGEEVPKTLKARLLDPNIDYARGEGRLVTDSSSDDESTDDDDDPEMYIDHVWGELDAEAETTDESTRRLAVCNMDWDRIRAIDLMMLFSSFLPLGGSIVSVKIYPSEFGKERMAQEEVHGPQELVGAGEYTSNSKTTTVAKDSNESDSEEELVQQQDSDAEEGDDYHMEKLRQYQLNRLRYYYAVVECDTVQTADKIYQECDGIEYESSATRVDLRFIPDDTNFDDDEPTDICTELPETSSYKPRQFTTTALQQAKVDLTWDETAVERRELSDKLSSGKIDEVSDKDLRKIVAYSSAEDTDDADDNNDPNDKTIPNDTSNTHSKTTNKKEDMIAKYKALLAEINEKEVKGKNQKYEMEFSWNVKDSTNDGKNDDDENNADSNTKSKQDLTPIEKVMQKRNEKNKKRKEERKKKKQGRGIDGADATDNLDSDSESIPDGIDLNDPYFAEEFANGDFIDTSSKAKQKEKLKKELKRKEEQEEEEEVKAKELQLLLDDDDEDEGKHHFSLEKILKSEQETKSKRKRRKQLKKSKNTIAVERKELEDNFDVNVNDERFKAIYSSHMFNIDPTDSHFKKTKGMDKLIEEKLKRRHGKADQQEPAGAEYENESKRPKKQLENTLLVKSLKRKIQLKQQK